jgi:hypothetical protein
MALPQVELVEARWVSDHLNCDNFPLPHFKIEYEQKLSIRGYDGPWCPLYQCRPCGLSPSQEVLRDAQHAPNLLYATQRHRCVIATQYDVRVKHREQRLEIPLP